MANPPEIRAHDPANNERWEDKLGEQKSQLSKWQQRWQNVLKRAENVMDSAFGPKSTWEKNQADQQILDYNERVALYPKHNRKREAMLNNVRQQVQELKDEAKEIEVRTIERQRISNLLYEEMQKTKNLEERLQQQENQATAAPEAQPDNVMETPAQEQQPEQPVGATAAVEAQPAAEAATTTEQAVAEQGQPTATAEQATTEGPQIENAELSEEQQGYNDLAKIILRANPLKKGNISLAESLQGGMINKKDGKINLEAVSQGLEAIATLRQSVTNSSWGKKTQELFDSMEQKFTAILAEEKQRVEADEAASGHWAEVDMASAHAAGVRNTLEAEVRAKNESEKANKEATALAFKDLSEMFKKYEALHPALWKERANQFAKGLEIDDANLEAGKVAIAELQGVPNLSKSSQDMLNRGLEAINHELDRRAREQQRKDDLNKESEGARVNYKMKQDLMRSMEQQVKGVKEQKNVERKLDIKALEQSMDLFNKFNHLHPKRYDDLAEQFFTGSPSPEALKQGLKALEEFQQLNLSAEDRTTLESAMARLADMGVDKVKRKPNVIARDSKPVELKKAA